MKLPCLSQLLFATALVAAPFLPAKAESLPPLVDGKAPQTFTEMWAGYDPRKEPLETEILKEWEADGVVLRVVRYQIGIFKGQKAMMAAVYGFPKGGRKLPGLVNIHGGGQLADYQAPLTNAKRGYATITLAWAGRIGAPGYTVSADVVKLFWDGKTTDPKYKVTTDWGALDAYHAPCKNPKNAFASVAPAEWTLDSVESPRNNSWFLCALGARRALTFLEQQPEVDPTKLGVYGHSMGGKQTVFTTASDARVKAAAPSCGGLSDRNVENKLYNATISDEVLLKNITCPIIFLSPSNDFHGRIDDLQKALREINSADWRVTCAPHHQHQDTAEYQVGALLWFDQYLKGDFSYPQTPKSVLNLKTPNGVPAFTVTPDGSKPIAGVDIFYTYQGQDAGEKDIMDNTKNRFWRRASAQKIGGSWSAELPLLSTDRPLWVYANVLYALDKPVTGAGYYYGRYTTSGVNLSSEMAIVSPAQLKESGVKATLKPTLLIESFGDNWQKEWFTYSPEKGWSRSTHKIYDPQWQAPAGARLALEVRSEQANQLVIGLDAHAAVIPLKGGSDWQPVVLNAADFINAAGAPLAGWKDLKTLRLSDKDKLKGKVDGAEKNVEVGAAWQGAAPTFRNLRWVEAN
jgi:hypothetical protein